MGDSCSCLVFGALFFARVGWPGTRMELSDSALFQVYRSAFSFYLACSVSFYLLWFSFIVLHSIIL